MRFTLYYRGGLHSNGGRSEKHKLRKHFHVQLAKLWKNLPYPMLRHIIKDRSPVANLPSIITTRGLFRFAPIVNSQYAAIADLKLTLLRPEPVGGLISGDLDNRLKTLFDALAVPQVGQLPKNAEPDETEAPFFCLLEDDALVADLRVETAECLDPTLMPKDVMVLMQVTTRITRHTEFNGFLA